MSPRLKILSILILLARAGASAASVREDIKESLARMAHIKMMAPGQTYTMMARGNLLTGDKEVFLRRREPEEILSSGLSSGCGDYAAAFYGLMREKGATMLYVDAAELSGASLANRNNGHTGVAVKDPSSGSWILTDPTSRRVLLDRWDSSRKIYKSGEGRFWIGFLGKLEDYPEKSPENLKAFYDRTLKAVPKSVWEDEIVCLELVPAGSDNPRLDRFLDRFSGLCEKFGINPKRAAKVELSNGGDDAVSECFPKESGVWNCRVGRQSSMSAGLFGGIESDVKRPL